MKLLKNCLSAICIVLGCFSCSNAKNNIVGSWKAADYKLENSNEKISDVVIEAGRDAFMKDALDFRKDGTYSYVNTLGFFLEEGTYKIEGDSLALHLSNFSARKNVEDEFKPLGENESFEKYEGHLTISMSKDEIRKKKEKLTKYLIRKVSDSTMTLAVDKKGGALHYTNVFVYKREK